MFPCDDTGSGKALFEGTQPRVTCLRGIRMNDPQWQLAYLERNRDFTTFRVCGRRGLRRATRL